MAEIGVGLVGYKFMGRTHSNAYRQLPRFFDVDPAPRMTAICGRDEAGVEEAAGSLGWESYETDYRRLVARDDVGLVDVVTPGNAHRDVVLAALEAGKHVICEKPLANTLTEAKEMVAAARNAGACRRQSVIGGSETSASACFRSCWSPSSASTKFAEQNAGRRHRTWG